MPNRSIQPKMQEVSEIRLPQIHEHILDNGIPLYEVNMGTQEVLKIEVIFNAGRPFEDKKLVSRATAGLLREGTVKRKASDIHEMVDFYGGSLSSPIDLDTSNIVMSCLKKHFETLLGLLTEVITEPAFQADELEIFKKNRIQTLKEDLTKNDIVAYRTITEKIFDTDHAYGYNSNEKTYNQLTREDLISHHEKKYTALNCKIIVSGKTDTETIAMVNKYLGKNIPQGTVSKSNVIIPSTIPQKDKIVVPGAIQTSIRIGCRLFTRRHEDYQKFYVLDAIFGGYFGSRLMTQIREKEGFTYNIFSSLDPMMFDGYFYVGTDVGNEFVEPTMETIYNEMEKLRTELIGEEELRMVQNYLMGFLLTTIDGAFSVAELVKMVKLQNLPDTYISDLARTIKTITPEEIMAMANKYLRKEKMWEVVVGV